MNPLAYGGSTGGGLAVLRGAIEEVVVVSIASIVSGRCIILSSRRWRYLAAALHCTVVSVFASVALLVRRRVRLHRCTEC